MYVDLQPTRPSTRSDHSCCMHIEQLWYGTVTAVVIVDRFQGIIGISLATTLAAKHLVLPSCSDFSDLRLIGTLVATFPATFPVSVVCCYSVLDCGPPKTMPNTVTSGHQFTYGSSVTVQCSNGYIGADRSSHQGSIKCSHDNQWRGVVPNCTCKNFVHHYTNTYTHV